jgi:DsbC/DsbD-like thiol-disulfide interchange protein
MKIFKIFLLSSFIFIITERINAQNISGFIGNGTVKKGSSVRGVVILEIPDGLHVNSNRPNNQYAIPTTLRLYSKDVNVGKVLYPRGKDKKFPFNENPINIYEGKVRFIFSVKVPQSFKGKNIKVRAVVRYQACNDEVCFPPKEKEVLLTARVV